MSVHLIRERADRDKSWRTVPVQNWGQASLSAVPSPCGNQAERYGERTARGMEAGLKGVAVHETAANAWSVQRPNAATNTMSMTGQLLSAVRVTNETA